MSTTVPRKIDVQTIPLLALPSLPFDERRRLPSCAAIYFVLNAAGTVLYIGQSINLAVRWVAHHRAAKLSEHQATRIAWLVMDDVALLDAVEAACIAYFDPLCNGFRGTRTTQIRSRGTGLERLPRRGDYVKRLIRIPTALCLWLEEDALKHGRTFNAHLMHILRASVTPEEWRALERKVRKARRATRPGTTSTPHA